MQRIFRFLFLNIFIGENILFSPLQAMEVNSSSISSYEGSEDCSVPSIYSDSEGWQESEVSSYSVSREMEDDPSYDDNAPSNDMDPSQNLIYVYSQDDAADDADSYESAFSDSQNSEEPFLPRKRHRKELNYCEISSSSQSKEEKESDTTEEAFPPAKKNRKTFIQDSTKNTTLCPKEGRKPWLPKFSYKDDSDIEAKDEGNVEKTVNPHHLAVKGIRLKLLANIYLRNLDETANVFLPEYTITTLENDGTLLKSPPSFFKTPKGEICVFVSGGVRHNWEKNVEYIYNLFFQNPGTENRRIKIIRASWIKKHLWREDFKVDLEEEFSGKENLLHSEYYYDLFFTHFFLPSLPKNVIQRLDIRAFSWWAVCDNCEGILSSHRKLLTSKRVLPSPDNLTYKIIARRRYKHAYPSSSVIQKTAYVKPEAFLEEKSWKKIWTEILKYVSKPFADNLEKKLFWTTTNEGLEVCKWLGQAFKINRYSLAAPDLLAKPGKKGDILTYYDTEKEEERTIVEELLTYLAKKNWDLCCWYKSPYPSRSGLEEKWKTYWKQVVMPHYGWGILEEEKKETKESTESEESEEDLPDCQMCGRQNLKTSYKIFHEKHRVKDKYSLTLCPSSSTPPKIKRSHNLALYLYNGKLHMQLKDKPPLEVREDTILSSEALHHLKCLLATLKDSSPGERCDYQESLLNYAFKHDYTSSKKFWQSVEEKKEKGCLIVGKDCAEILTLTKKDVKEWCKAHPDREEKALYRSIVSDYRPLAHIDKNEKEKKRKRK